MFSKELTVIFRGQEFPLSTSLRVAYEVQNQNNHKPYTQVFEQLGDMALEQQIAIVWSSFKCANKDYVSAERINVNDFVNSYLDTYNLSELMDTLKYIISGITGKDLSEAETKAESENSSSDEGNVMTLV